jgi:CheY-like chemotaxis protein
MSPAHETHARKKILIVDDSRTALLMEAMILRDEPYLLVTASDGQEAVEKALEERPDLILMDVVMPRMSGVEACRVLRAREETRDIPIIMCTTRSDLDDLELGYASGCAEYVVKPIHGPELLAKVHDVLPVEGIAR